MASWITLSLFGMALSFLAVALAWAVLRNMRVGEWYRARLAERLEALRLRRLMGLLGLDTDRYLHRERIVDVERHMRSCAQCPEMARCDDALSEQRPEVVATFCANYEDLKSMRNG